MSMDTHLTTIGSTLEAIARLHASAPSSSRNVYRPFTCAVLNTYKLDVLDFIRDADQVESNLFWYPPPPGGPSGTKGESEVVEDTIAPGVTARLPEPKEFIPPTPLRKTAIEAEARGLVQFDARTLLKAAQRLVDNYQHLPRARKHIRALLKRQSELEKQMLQHESTISKTEILVAKFSNPEQSKAVVASMKQMGQPQIRGTDQEFRELQESIRNERMEILAIEQTTEDLLEKRQKILSQKARAAEQQLAMKQSSKPRTSAIKATNTPSARSGSATPKARTPVKSLPSSQSGSKPKSRASLTAQKINPASSSLLHSDTQETKNTLVDDVDGDVTVRDDRVASQEVQSQVNHAELMPVSRLTEPESSDELERICENVWSLFGDNLRYVAVDREGADYGDTLRILQDLSIGGGSGTFQGDSSMMSSSSGSQATAATSGSNSSTSGNLENAGPPSATVAIAAHVLLALLTTPAPHVMEFDELKAEGESWWNTQGREALSSSAVGKEASDLNDSSSALASKAVYSLIAKKLLRLQFRGAKRIISFPAHIG